MTPRLTPEELDAIRNRRAQARASLAIEGMVFTKEQDAVFEQFDTDGLAHDERRRRLLARLSKHRHVPAE